MFFIFFAYRFFLRINIQYFAFIYLSDISVMILSNRLLSPFVLDFTLDLINFLLKIYYSGFKGFYVVTLWHLEQVCLLVWFQKMICWHNYCWHTQQLINIDPYSVNRNLCSATDSIHDSPTFRLSILKLLRTTKKLVSIYHNSTGWIALSTSKICLLLFYRYWVFSVFAFEMI